MPRTGICPRRLVLASAIAARTERLPIMLAAVVLPFWDPVRLAEDMSVLDIISKGRVSYAFGIGHRPRSTNTSASTCVDGVGWPTRSWRC